MNKLYPEKHSNGKSLIRSIQAECLILPIQILAIPLKIAVSLIFALLFAQDLSGAEHLMSVNHQTSDSVRVKVLVRDNTGTLPGVSVLIKGSSWGGGITDNNGEASVFGPATGTLLISFLGYQSREIAIEGRLQLNVTLTEDAKALDEVVIIGYGAQSREKVIGSIAQISGEELTSRPVTQLKNALAGQLPGVSIIQRHGSPGVGSGVISIRGVGSFGASPNALVLIDGTPVSNFNDIDPNDVQSISVLKDASSAAIYGSRGANGVILVTTKSGNAGTPKITFNSYIGSQAPTLFPEYVHSWEYQQAYFEALNGTTLLTQAQQTEVEKYRAQNDVDYPNNNFLDMIIAKRALQTGHSASVNGGNNTNKYNVSLGYLHQDGLVIQNNYSRYNLRSNMTTSLGSKVTMTTRLAAISSLVNEPVSPVGTGATNLLSIIGQTARTPGIFVARYPNGDFGAGLGNAGTPVSFLSSKSFSKQKGLNLNGNLRLDYQVVKDLKLSFTSSYVQNTGRETAFRASQRINSSIFLGPNQLTENTSTSNYYTLQGLADYSKQKGKHYFSVLGGYSFEDFKSDNFAAFRDNMPGNDLTVLNIGSPNNQQANGSRSEYALESQFARVNYSYANRYLVEGVVRRDGSSRFPTSQKYAVFPSLAAGWRVGQENFIKENLPWISELKLKASWGILGNQEISNYPYQNTLIYSDADVTGTSYNFGGAIAPGAARTTLVDSTLHWESTRTKDLGLEVGIFKNKFNFSATYFDRYTYDILYSPASSVSKVLGFALSQRNTGKLKNTGWEFTAGHANTVGKFGYNLNGNFTIVNNEVLDLGVGNITQPNGMVGNGSNLFIGHPNSNSNYNLYYGYIADGLFIDQQDIIEYQKTNNQNSINPSPEPGDIRYKDLSGPEGAPDGIVDATYDRVVLGSQIPKYSYGVNLGTRYGGFDVSALLQGISGVSGRLEQYAGYAFFNTAGNIQRWQYDGRWTDQNPARNAIYPRLETIPNTGTPNTLLSSFWIQNGSYLRLKNLQFGYTIPQGAVARLKMSNARIYLSGDNLHTFSNYAKGWDPEVNGTGAFYPIVSVYTVGLSVTF